jgi:hypothetical protein
MIKPLLYLLHNANLESAARIRVIEELVSVDAAAQASSAKLGQPPCQVLVVTSMNAGKPLDVLLAALSRYPQLSAWHVSMHVSIQDDVRQVHDWCLQTNNDSPQFIVLRHGDRGESALTNPTAPTIAQSNDTALRPILEAMSAGVPVLIPDSAFRDASFVRDGINGFLYRAHDPDSLALSLLTLKSVSHEVIQRVVEQARNTLRELGDSLVLAPHKSATGDAQ